MNPADPPESGTARVTHDYGHCGYWSLEHAPVLDE